MRPAKEIGDLAEVLVNYQLSAAGLVVFAPSSSHLPYDLLVDAEGGRFLRIQVKGSLAPRTYSYLFNVVSETKGSRDNYKIADLDWFAFVALDIEQVIYVPAREVIEKGTKQISIPIARFAEEHLAARQAVINEANPNTFIQPKNQN